MNINDFIGAISVVGNVNDFQVTGFSLEDI